MPLSILVVGGYGEFGGRVSELLLLDGHTVYVAGRSYQRAISFTQAKGGVPLVFDRKSDVADITATQFDIVVDAAGPFQTYQDTGDNYEIAKACIEQGVHYLDLSDDGQFTAGIDCLNEKALDAGCIVLSGVSSTPALSSAVVNELRERMDTVEVIETTILPGSNAPRGRSVMEAILGQVGNSMNIWRGGRWVSVEGWSESKPIALAVAENNGQPTMQTRKASLISTPDSVLFPFWFGAKSVLFRAGLELGFMHSSLSILGRLRRCRLLPSLIVFYKPLDYLASVFAYRGTDKGGMVVAVTGRMRDENSDESDYIAVRRVWSLHVETSGKGPFVAAAPVRAIVNNIRNIEAGARACLCELALDDFLKATQELDTTVKLWEELDPVLLQRVLGSSWQELPAAVKRTHLVDDVMELVGRGSVVRGEHIIARLIAAVFRFPPANVDVAVSVLKKRTRHGETWIRNFAGHQFKSDLSHLPDVQGGGVVNERFGLLSFELALDVSNNCMSMPVSRGWCLGIALPKFMLPVSITREYELAGRMYFDVRLELPFSLGLLVHYKGHLKSAAE